jgi:outer membrane protein
MKLRIIASILMLSCFVGMSQNKKWTLRECVNYALEQNISVKQSELNLERTDIERLDALGNFIPSINASTGYATSTGLGVNATTGILENQTQSSLSAGVSAGLTLFDGLRNIKQLQRAKLSKLAAQYQLDNMKDDIALFVVNSYLQVLFSRESLRVAQAQNAVTLQDLKRTKELVEAGVVPEGDLLDIESTAATQEQQIVNAENSLRLSKIALAQLLLIQDYENFDISDEDYLVPSSTVLNNSPNEIYAKALDVRKNIQLSETNVELAKKDVEIAKGALYPRLSANFNYNTRYADNNPLDFVEQLYTFDGISYGLSLSVPILNGFAAKNNIKRSKIAQLNAEYQLQQDKLDLENTVNQAWNDARASAKAYEAAQKTFIARTNAYNYAKERFDVGLMNSFDFSQSQARVENAEAEVVRTKYDYIFKLKVLEYYFGIPIDQL